MNKEYRFDEVLQNFDFIGSPLEHKPYGNGHINDTFLLTSKSSAQRYILQRMNHEIFRDPKGLMENISHVTEHLKKKIIQNGGDPSRETLNIVPTISGGSYFVDSEGNFWRAYLFIEETVCLDAVTKPEDFYQSAFAFGQFQNLLADFPAQNLHETIVDFHNTAARFKAFEKAVFDDPLNRVKEAQAEIDFAMSRKAQYPLCVNLQASGELPLRVTHNDTKLNNVMLDKVSGKGICVIDLDTVMPGLAINDFGDSIRFGASTAAEDEPDLDKVWMDLTLFEAYTKGFLEACGNSLTSKEMEMLPWGAKLMTCECGMRFLTDYLQGDSYFKIHRPGQNLDRARTQFKLVSDMETKWADMHSIVNKYSK